MLTRYKKNNFCLCVCGVLVSLIDNNKAVRLLKKKRVPLKNIDIYHANETAERRAQVLKTVLVSKCSIKRLSKNHTKCFISVLL